MINKEEIWDLFKSIFPIYRTLLGKGFNDSLDEISKTIPLTNIYEVESGQSSGSWKIPDEWIIHTAWIADLDGNKIIDFKENQFHIWQYSISTDEIISHEELIKKIAIGDDDCIPLVVTYYSKRWGFSVSANQFEKLNRDQYRVYVDSEFRVGKLQIGEIFLKGRSSKEVLIDAVLSCNSLANNLSGVLGAVFIAKLISQTSNHYYSYRILFSPETIGPISLFHHFPSLFKNVQGGFNLINLADKNALNYKTSRYPTLIDDTVEYTLKQFDKDTTISKYDVLTGTCGNEKAYNSLGIEVPVGALRRSILCSYPEYDTSKDDFGFIDKNKFFESLDILTQLIQNIELNLYYKHTFIGEPFLTGYGLFPKIEKDSDRIPYDYLMGFTNGKLSLLDIVNLSNQPLQSFFEPLRLMVEKELLKEI
ncbi:DUF4910 domain-containing protein [Cytophagaceae bacterium 50C-KIRBA]|uniref:DUF4910 domain-containing protein n=1 Tax=Aquirufa beregesia TaxID=2516556 RepID=A0ABX0EWR3_9BACT|nr:DUF4910 domain-containing protein [Aquirufa beregesia]NGZ43776.1 DUF4910 domain-containing protein [Aquirufa beregesia]